MYEWKHATPEQSKELVELGVILDTQWLWVKWKEDEKWRLILRSGAKKEDFPTPHWIVDGYILQCLEAYPAPDLAELGEAMNVQGLMGRRYSVVCKRVGWAILDREQPGIVIYRIPKYGPDKPEAQARAAAFIFLLKNKHLKPEDCKL